MRLNCEAVMVSPRVSVGRDWSSMKIDNVADTLKVGCQNETEWGEKEENGGGLYSLSVNSVPSLPPQQKLVVGYALTSKKINSFLRPSLEGLARKKGIMFVAIDHCRSLLDQGPFDIVLHKISGKEWCQILETGCSLVFAASLLMAKLVPYLLMRLLVCTSWLGQEYQLKHPEVTVLDPPDAIKQLHNRQSMLKDVAALNLCGSNGKIGVPKQLVVEGDPNSIPDAVNRAGLNFPLVAKPLFVDGTARSHEMSLAYDQFSLSKLETPLVLQEFVNHGGVLFKVYIVGETVKVVRRFSLPDVEKSEQSHNVGVVQFPRVSCAAASADDADLHPRVAELPPLPLLEKLAQELRQRLGLQLFNIDIIRQHGSRNSFYVIDINYFPGYGKMPNYEQIFTEFFLSLGHDKSKKCLVSYG